MKEKVFQYVGGFFSDLEQ
jgi:Kelch motif